MRTRELKGSLFLASSASVNKVDLESRKSNCHAERWRDRACYNVIGKIFSIEITLNKFLTSLEVTCEMNLKLLSIPKFHIFTQKINFMFSSKCFLQIVLLVSLLFSSCKDFQEINVSKIDGFKVKSLTQEGISGEVKVKIKNPNPIGFNVYRSSCDVYFGDLYLGKAKLKKRIRVGANSDSEHTFKLEGKFKDMSLLQLTSLLSGKSKSLVLKGNLKVGKFFYRKNFPIDRKEKIDLGK